MKPILIILALIFTTAVSCAQTEKFSIHFPFNSSTITAAEAARIDSFIRTTPQINVLLTGHTDSRGSNAYNEALSERRVDAVYNYLLNNDPLKKYTITKLTFGETKLITTDDAEEAKGLVNRRVEIIWINVKEKFLVTTTPAQPEIKTAKNISGSQEISEILKDSAIKKGALLVLKDLNFIGGRHILLKSSLKQQLSLLSAMRENPRLKISIEGHICCLPDPSDGFDFDTHTEDLSFQRAKAIAAYLFAAGIDESRVLYRGFAHSMPLFPYPENNEAEKTANRRVEVRILEK